jgi:hypothetical protein
MEKVDFGSRMLRTKEKSNRQHLINKTYPLGVGYDIQALN